jgi:hypothetical protein
MTTSSSPVQLHELHPVEQLLALLLTSAAALHRLFSEPPRVIRQKPAPFVRRDITHAVAFAVETCLGTTPATGSPVSVLPTKAIAVDWSRSILDPVRETTLCQPGKRAPLSSHNVRNLSLRTIRELQQMARERGMRSVDGRPLKYCKKARLVEVLSNG